MRFEKDGAAMLIVDGDGTTVARIEMSQPRDVRITLVDPPADSFRVGDVVQLKSGTGPDMVVTEDGIEIECVWFDGNMRQTGNFPAAALERA